MEKLNSKRTMLSSLLRLRSLEKQKQLDTVSQALEEKESAQEKLNYHESKIEKALKDSDNQRNNCGLNPFRMEYQSKYMDTLYQTLSPLEKHYEKLDVSHQEKVKALAFINAQKNLAQHSQDKNQIERLKEIQKKEWLDSHSENSSSTRTFS